VRRSWPAAACGVRVVMVTGDHPGTAGAIAGEVGLFQPGQNGAERVLTGRDLRRTGFPPDPATVPVYARVDPEQKLTLVETLRASGHVVSVTGTASTTRRRCGAPTSGSPWARGQRRRPRGGRHGDHRRQPGHHRDGGPGRPWHLRQIRKVVDYLVAGNLSEIMVVVASLLAFPALGDPAAAVAAPVDQPAHRRAARDCARRRSGRPVADGATATLTA